MVYIFGELPADYHFFAQLLSSLFGFMRDPVYEYIKEGLEANPVKVQ